MADEEYDITDFSGNLQKTLKENLLPTKKQVSDLVGDLNSAIATQDFSAAIDLVGTDKVKALKQELMAGGASFEKMKEESVDLTQYLSKSADLANLQTRLSFAEEAYTKRIANAQAEIEESQSSIVPEMQKKIEMAKIQLNFIDETDIGYKSHLNKIKELELSLDRENSRIADITGQQQALVRIKDEEISKYKEIQESSTDITSATNKIKQNNQEIVNQNIENLKLNKDLSKVIEGLGPNMKKLLEDNKDLLDEYGNMFDSMKNSMIGIIERIPLIGGLLASSVKKPLEDSAKKAKEAFSKGFLEAASVAKDKGIMEGLVAGANSFKAALSGVGSMLSAALSGPVLIIGSIVALLALAFKRFVEIDKATGDFRRELGLSQDTTIKLEKSAQRINKEYAGWGVGITEAIDAAKSLVNVLGNVNIVSESTAGLIAKMSASLGVTEDNAAGAFMMFKKLGASSSENAENLVKATVELSNLAGVPAGKVMEDVANASEEAYLFMAKMPHEMVRAAVEARRIGSSLDSAAKTADHLLNFEQSITSEMKLASLVGRHVNLDRMRRFAIEGDMVGMQKEQLRIMKEAGGFDQMNMWQKKAMAEALGTSVSELSKMSAIEKENAEFARQNPELARQYNAELEKLAGGQEKSLAKRAEERMKQAIQEQKMLAMQNQFNAMMVELGEALLPAINATMSALLPILKVIGFLVSVLVAPFALIGDIIAAIGGDTDRLKDRFTNFGSAAATAIAGIGIALALAMKGGMSAATGFFSFFGKGLKGMLGGIKNLGSKLLNKIPGVGGFGGGGGVDIPTPKPPTGGGPGGGMVNSVVDGFSRINTTDLIKASGAMLILSGALFITAKAFKEFSDVSWSGVGAGLVALTGLVVAAKFLEKGSTSMMKGAGAIAILGLALLPAAFAFQMFSEVSWTGVWAGIGTLVALTAAMFGLGALIAGPGALIFGAGVLGIMALGAALIPFAYAASLAAPAIDAISRAFATTATALNELEFSSIGKIILLGGAIATLGAMMPLILLGSVAMGVMAWSLSSLGESISEVAEGFESLDEHLSGSVDNIAKLARFESKLEPIAEGLEKIGGSMAMLAGGGFMGSVAGFGSSIADLGKGVVDFLNPFKDASEEAQKGPFDEILKIVPFAGDIEKLGVGIYGIASGLQTITNLNTDSISGLVTALEDLMKLTLGDSAPTSGGGFLSNVFSPVTDLGGEASEDISSPTGGADMGVANTPVKKMVSALNEFAKISDDSLGVLDMVSNSMARLAYALTMINIDQVETIYSLGDAFSDIGKILPKVRKGADALQAISGEFEDLTEKMNAAAPGLEVLVDSLTSLKNLNITEELGESLGDGLQDLGEGLEDFVDYMVDADLDTMTKTLPQNLKVIGNAISSFSSINISADLGDQLEDLGEGLEDFLDYMDDADLSDASSKLSANLDAIGKSLQSFSTLDIKSDLGDKLQDFGEGLEDFLDYMDDADLATASDKLTQNLSILSKALTGFSTLNIRTDLGEELEQFGEGLEDFLDYMDDADLATTSASLTDNLSALSSALTGFSTLNIRTDLGEKLEQFGEGLEDFLDYMDDADLATASANLSKNLSDLGSALSSFSTLDIRTDLGEKLEQFGEGLEDFLDYMDDADLATASASLTKNLSQLGASLKSFSTFDIQTDIGEKLEQFGEGLEDFLDYMDDADLATTSANLSKNLSYLGSALSSFSTLDIKTDLGEKLEQFGEGLEDFLDYMDDADLATASANLSRNLDELGSALKSFSSFDIQTDIGEKLEDFGEGLEDFLDYMDDADLATASVNLTKNLDKLGSALTAFSSVRLTTEIGDKLEDFGEGLEDFLDYMDDADLAQVSSSMNVNLSSLGSALTQFSSLNIKGDMGNNLESFGAGIEEFIDYLDDDELEVVTGKFVSQMTGLGNALKSMSGLQISEEFGGNIKNLGNGLEEFLDYLDDDEMETMTTTFANQMSLLSTSLVALSGVNISTNFGKALENMGSGIEEFSDYLNDGEGKDIGNFFRSAGSSLIRFVEGIAQIANVKQISLTSSLSDLTKIASTIDESTVQKVELVSSRIVSALNSFSEIDDPVIASLKALNTELNELGENINKLDANKLSSLQGISVQQVSQETMKPNIKQEPIKFGSSGFNMLSEGKSTSDVVNMAIEKLGVHEESVEKKQTASIKDFQNILEQKFMTRVGGEDKFKNYMQSKEDYKIASQELSKFKTENESFKITKKMEDEIGFTYDALVGYKGDDKNQQYQELLSKSSETKKAMVNTKRGLENEYIKNTARTTSSTSRNIARSKFDLDMRVYENQIPMNYVRDVKDGIITESAKGNLTFKNGEVVSGENQQIKLPPQDPFMSENIITGSIEPKFMEVKQTSLQEVFAEKIPSPSTETLKTQESLVEKSWWEKLFSSSDETKTEKSWWEKLFSSSDVSKSEEIQTDSTKIALADVFSTPLDVRVINSEQLGGTSIASTSSSLAMKDSSYINFKNELIEQMGDKTLDGYAQTITSYIDLNKKLIEDSKKPGGSVLDVNKFKTENAYMQTMLKEIEVEKSEEQMYKAESVEQNKRSQLTSAMFDLESVRKIIEKETMSSGGVIQPVTRLKLSDVLGESYTDIQIQTKKELDEKLGMDLSLGDVSLQTNEKVMQMLREKETNILNQLASEDKQKQIQLETSSSVSSVVSPPIPELNSLNEKELETGIKIEQMAQTVDVPTQQASLSQVSPMNIVNTREVENGRVEQRILELIELLKGGKIAVNMDGKKVSSALAKAQND
jgi:hypothetical protein